MEMQSKLGLNKKGDLMVFVPERGWVISIVCPSALSPLPSRVQGDPTRPEAACPLLQGLQEKRRSFHPSTSAGALTGPD